MPRKPEYESGLIPLLIEGFNKRQREAKDIVTLRSQVDELLKGINKEDVKSASKEQSEWLQAQAQEHQENAQPVLQSVRETILGALWAEDGSLDETLVPALLEGVEEIVQSLESIADSYAFRMVEREEKEESEESNKNLEKIRALVRKMKRLYTSLEDIDPEIKGIVSVLSLNKTYAPLFTLDGQKPKEIPQELWDSWRKALPVKERGTKSGTTETLEMVKKPKISNYLHLIGEKEEQEASLKVDAQTGKESEKMEWYVNGELVPQEQANIDDIARYYLLTSPNRARKALKECKKNDDHSFTFEIDGNEVTTVRK